jgi:hypothetical protein
MVTDQNIAMNSALAAAEAEEEIERIVNTLDRTAAQLVLARLFRKFSGSVKSAGHSSPSKTRVEAAPAAHVNGATVDRRRRGKRKVGVWGNKTSIVMAKLVEHPHIPIVDLARAVYGDGGRVAQRNLRSLLNGLKVAGKATNVEPGKWEVVPQRT